MENCQAAASIKINIMVGSRNSWLVIVVIAGVLVMTGLPYLLAARAAEPAHVFAGFLLNPQDGNSYLAKMVQGWRGEWRFTLPYTSDPGKGAYLFLFYISLGHLARLLGLSLPLAFHLSRLLGALVLLLALYRFFAAIFPQRKWHLLAFTLAAGGSGMGWLALPFGAFTSDFWGAEAYPFLSAYATPHFSLGLALLLGLVTVDWEKERRDRDKGIRGGIPMIVGSLALSIISPFGVVIVLVVLGTLLVWQAAVSGWDWKTIFRELPGGLVVRFVWVLLAGAPLLVYDLWVAHTDPVLSGWNAQNLTPSPAFWDLIVSFSPVILLALPAAWVVLRCNNLKNHSLLIWAGLGLLLLYLPWGLQRRFMMGLYIPLAGLAVLTLERWANRQSRRWIFLVVAVFLLALPTNLLVVLAGQHGVQTRDPQLFLTRGEVRAFNWISENTPPHALILAAPGTGLFIPAYTGRRVIYGHPFETVDAEAEKSRVIQFFTGAGSGDAQVQHAFLAVRGVDYIFTGPRERQLGDLPALTGVTPVYAAEGVTVWAVEK